MTQEQAVQNGPASVAQPVAPRQLAWLENELSVWRAAGIVDDAQSQRIRGSYVESRRFSLTRLLLFLGSGFIGIGLLWLVATNLDNLSPVLRFAVVTMLWLGFVLTAEVLAERRMHRAPEGSLRPSPLVGTFRILATLSFGAVVFQAAQSLQVPAYEPALLGVWGLGALLYAYAVGGVTPLLIGIGVTTSWFVWDVLEASQDGFGFVLPVLLSAVFAAAIAVSHSGRWRTEFAAPWREASAVLALLGLFVAAFPHVDMDEFTWSVPLVAGILVVIVATAASVALASNRARWEALAPLGALAAGVLLVLWQAPEPVEGAVGGEGYAHAFVSVAVYVLAAGWYAVLGVLRNSTRLTVVATAALVLFTTVQSFAVFAPIITGATLFLVLGVVFLVSGYLFDRGRRHLVANLEGATA